MFRTKVKKVYIWVLILFLISFLSNPCLAAISVQEIINNMQKAHAKQMVGINDYMVIQKPSGGLGAIAGETKMYYKKAKVDGEEIYKTRTETEVMGMKMVSIYDGKYSWSTNPFTGKVESKIAEGDPLQFWNWKSIDSTKTEYLGEEMIDGEKAYILRIDNAMQVMSSQAQAAAMQENRPQEVTGKLWLSSKTWMPLRMEMIMKADSEGMVMNIITTTLFEDYREVGTIIHPFKIIANTSTEIDTSGVSEEVEEEGEEMWEMMQSMMSEMGSFTIETVEVKVNTGLSDDLFDGTKLK